MGNIRQIALQAPLKKQAFFVPAWDSWVALQELDGEERADLLQSCTTVKKVAGKAVSKVDIKRLYPMLVIQSTLYADADTMPDKSDVNYLKYPGAVDENGTVITPVEETPGTPIFTMADLGPLNKTSGATLELLNKPASILSGLREEDIESKKEDSEENPDNTVESTGFTLE